MKLVNQPDQFTGSNQLTRPLNHSLRLWLKICALISIFIYSYSDAIYSLIRTWLNRDDYSHGFIVPFIALYFVWVGKEKLKSIPVKPNIFAGLILMILANLMLLLGHTGGIVAIQEVSVIVIIPGLILLLLGTEYFKALIFTISYLVLMIPSILDVVVHRIQWPFQLLSATLASILLKILNIPVFQEAQFLHLSNITLEVAAECSGVRYLISIIAIAIPLAYFTQQRFWRRMSLVTIGIIVGILVNIVRVTLIGVWAYYDGGIVHGPGHIFQGLFVSVVGYIFLFMGAWVLKESPSFNIARHRVENGEGSNIDWFLANKKPFNKVWLIAILFLAAFGVYIHQYKSIPVPLTNSLQDFPLTIGDWKGEDIDYQKSTFPFRIENADQEIMRNYTNKSGDEITLYVSYFETQSQEKELINDELKGLYGNSKEADILINSGESIIVNKASMMQGGDRWEMLYWYNLDGYITANIGKAKLITALEGLLYRRTNGAVIMVARKMNDRDELQVIFNEEAGFTRQIYLLWKTIFLK